MSIDYAIVLLFLIVTLLLGYFSGRNLKTFKEYSIAYKGYSTPVLIATIFATVIGGGSTMGVVEKVYKGGFVFALVFCGMALNRILVAKLIVPRLRQYAQESISLGDIMHDLYGNMGQLILGISAVLVSLVSVGTQVFTVGHLFHYFLGLSPLFGIVVGCGIFLFYSAFGGMRSVVATDVLQFFFIVVLIPIVCTLGLEKTGGITPLVNQFSAHFFMSPDMTGFGVLALFLSLLVGSADPSFLQRLLVAKDQHQAAQSTTMTGYLSFFFYILMGFLGLMALSLYPSSDPSSVLVHFITDTIPVGLRGIVICGLLAAVMSTADSDLNMVGICSTHDVLAKIRGITLSEKEKLVFARYATFVLGTFTIYIASQFKSILEIVVYAFSFWGPAALVPLMSGIIGYRVQKNWMMFGVLNGCLTTFLWNIFLEQQTEIPGILPGTLWHFLLFSLKAEKIR